MCAVAVGVVLWQHAWLRRPRGLIDTGQAPMHVVWCVCGVCIVLNSLFESLVTTRSLQASGQQCQGTPRQGCKRVCGLLL